MTRQDYIELRFGFTFQACHSTPFIQLILDVLGYTSEVFYRPCIVRVGDRFSSESEVSYCPCIVCVGIGFPLHQIMIDSQYISCNVEM